MVRTRVGYCGGQAPNPTYHQLGDHSEAIQIDFDPHQITYARLLEEARAEGSFGDPAFSRQYRSAVFYHSEEQKRQALQAGLTEVEPVGNFTRAEDYHQKYYLQQSNLVGDFYAMYPDDLKFTDSTAVARANAIVAGFINQAEVETLLPSLGVSEKTAEGLRRQGSRSRPGCGMPH